jgi:small nuclear ribonucleoprotein (snRNP)-like protein
MALPSQTQKRPLDFLNDRVGRRVRIAMKGGQAAPVYEGVLVAFDLHLNIWLDDASDVVGPKVPGKPLLLRGDMVVSVGDAND